MQELKELELSVLIDMLAQCTDRYMNILSEGGSMEEFKTCKSIIEFLQKEIELKRNAAGIE